MSLVNKAIVPILGILLAGFPSLARTEDAAPKIEQIRFDAQSWNPLSLVVRERHLLETAFGDGVKIVYLPAADGATSIARLQAGIIDVASASTISAALARANGNTIRLFLVWGYPQWAALLVRADGQIATLTDLKGRRIAYGNEEARYYMARALARAGLGARDVVPVRHSELDGRMALEAQRVDGWFASDPQRAAAEREAGDRPLDTGPSQTPPGVLVVRSAYATAHPDRIAKIVAAYAQARQWASDHPEDLTKIIAQAAAMSPVSAAQALARTRLAADAVTGETADGVRQALIDEIKDLQSDGRIPPERVPETMAAQLLDGAP